MDKLTDELARVLVKRMTAALEKARYNPTDVDSAVVAAEVVRPFLLGPQSKSVMKRRAVQQNLPWDKGGLD